MKLTEMSKEKKTPKPATNTVFNQNNELYGSATGLDPISKQNIHLVKISSKRQQNTCD